MRQSIQELQAYHVDERTWEIKLDANERAGDLPEHVRQSIIQKLSNLSFQLYPDMGMKRLRQAIAKDAKLDLENVLIGCGSSELLMALCQTFGGPGKSIIYPQPSFSMYGIYAKLSESEPVPVALRADFSLDVDKVVAAIDEKTTGLIMLCNPNNPTGNVMDQAEIETILKKAKCPVVIDEAYIEFFGETSLPLLKKYSNLVITRTFSKAFGLASARIGYLFADSSITQAVSKALMPYHVNALSLLAAEAVYEAKDEVLKVVEETIAEREALYGQLKKLSGIEVYPSKTNFLLFKSKKNGLYEALAGRGIGVRDFGTAQGLEGCIRVTMGTKQENAAFLAAVQAFVEEANECVKLK